MLMQLINKKISIGEPVLQDALVFLVKTYLKPVLGDSYEIGYYKVDFCNVYVELYKVGMEIEMILEQKIIKLVRLSATEGVRDTGFSSP